jgi:replication initiation and membrane attachment protein DnaB
MEIKCLGYSPLFALMMAFSTMRLFVASECKVRRAILSLFASLSFHFFKQDSIISSTLYKNWGKVRHESPSLADAVCY